MTVSRLSGNRVLIFLEETDMREYALDFSRMDKSDSHSMRVLSDLSREACRGEGIPTGGMRLHVEALGMNDGCYLLVTVSARKKTYRRRQGTLCYRFESVSDFLDCLSLLGRKNDTQRIRCRKAFLPHSRPSRRARLTPLRKKRHRGDRTELLTS